MKDDLALLAAAFEQLVEACEYARQGWLDAVKARIVHAADEVDKMRDERLRAETKQLLSDAAELLLR